jgi:DNA-binding protein HU-beta
MKEAELIHLISERTSFSEEVVGEMMQALVDVIIETVSVGKKVKIDRLGMFERRSRLPRQGRNPLTGEILDIPGTHLAAFSAAETFAERVAGKNS